MPPPGTATGPRGSFLFVTWSGGGNLHPLVALGVRLRDRGHVVRVLAPAELRHRFESEGLGFAAHRRGEEWTGGNPMQTREQRHSATDEQRAAFLRGLGDDLIAEASRSRTDVIVVDYMQPQALSAAEVLGPPTVAYVHTLYQRVAAGESSPMAMAASTDALNRLRAELGLDPVPTLPSLLDRCDRVLVVTSDELDRPEVPLPTNVRYVGPIVESAGPDLTWAPPWRANEQPLVHVSMGTVPPDDLVLPLVQQALDALGPLPVHTFVTLAGRPQRPWQGATDPDVPSLRIPDNAAVAPYVRHAAVLPHTALFITHAGLSSIGAALTYGVPMVCAPIFNEQPDNAAHVEALGAGRVVPAGATVDELRAVVTEVLEEPRFREVSRRIASRLRETGNGRLAVQELENLLS